MPSTPLYDRTGKTVGNVELSDELFAAPVNTAVLHQVVTAQLAAPPDRHRTTPGPAARSAVAAAKPYRQKGTGRARQGSTQRAALPRRRRRSSVRTRARTSSGCRAR